MIGATELLVIGAGPYALSIAALARERGLQTVVLGRAMEFWREHMPQRMFLRSGPEWHLDASRDLTLAAYLDAQGLARRDVDPIPLELFLGYCDWFRREKGIEVRDDFVSELAADESGFEARLESGDRIRAGLVVCAPGARHYAHAPEWASAVPEGRSAHTSELVRFEDLAGSRVLIVGGRQSAYEWAALIREAGAERVDLVHRHDVPRFDRVSWEFVDAHVERTTSVAGYWRNLPRSVQDAVAKQFWSVGRLTLEWWLAPRVESDSVHLWPRTHVVDVTRNGSDELEVSLSSSERLSVDSIVFASGYRADLSRVPYLAGLLDRIVVADGYPVLDEAFGTSLPGLYVTGFSATRSFGPFFGFVKGAPAAATLIVRDALARGEGETAPIDRGGTTSFRRGPRSRGVFPGACEAGA